MARLVKELECNLEVEFTEISDDELPTWRADLLLLLQLLKEEKRFLEAKNGIVDVDCIGRDDGIGIALFPLEARVEG